MTISEQVGRFVAMKRKLGYRFVYAGSMLSSFASFAEARGETFIRSETAITWASTSASQNARIRRLHTVHHFGRWLQAEDPRHEVPPLDALGRLNMRRPQPRLISVSDIRKLLTVGLSMGPADTITPLTWHYLFGLVAVTGMRIGEALALTLDDITADGLVVRDTKFGKSRMVVLHPTTWNALNRYLETRLGEKTSDRHLFVIASGRSPHKQYTSSVFRQLTEQVGIRDPGAARGPTLHSLRHSFAVRSLENLAPDIDPSRHMMALSTYLGHVEVSSTYWYLESTSVLMRSIAEAAEETHAKGVADD